MNKLLVPLVFIVSAVVISACMSNDEQKSVTTTDLVAQAAPPLSPSNDGQTLPKPVFQLGENVSKPYDDKSEQALDFVNFYNGTYDTSIDLLSKENVVWFPPQYAGDTSLEFVARVTQDQTLNCDNPGTYPILCEDGFSTAEFCKACHDSVLFVEGGGLQQMAYFSEPDFTEQHTTWLANWSQYGDWSANIMRLATRDPIWQAQIETETNVHKFADPIVIQDVCFSCHGEMGERQLKMDLGPDQHFCTDLFYATIGDTLSEQERGVAFPFNPDCQPVAGKSVGDNLQFYAKYGSLARDGVSCETCHRIGPEYGAGAWGGQDYTVFYGATDTYNVAQRQPQNPVPLPYEFTATFDYDMNHIMTPDPLSSLDAQPMRQDDNLEIAQAINEHTGDTYLGQSVICGACHVLIVPQIPTSFQPDQPIPTSDQAKYYLKPEACDGTFAPATRGKYGNPVTDNCVALGYEQATYLEWINSSFASEEVNDNTCQGCHMPLVTHPNDPTNHTAIMAQSTPGLTPKNYRRHRLMGINLPVFEMFVQFPEVLGVAAYDDLVPPSGGNLQGQSAPFIQNYLLNGQMAIVEQATSQANGNGLVANSTAPDNKAATEIVIEQIGVDASNLNVDLTVMNNTGHKFPSGAGFRRAFLRFEVFDASNKLLWVSGQTNPFGAICAGECVKGADEKYNLLPSEVNLAGDPTMVSPHHQVISRQDQVQIYEVQAVNDLGVLTSQTLSLFHDAKDNRLLPGGYIGPTDLGCDDDPNAGRVIFGIKQCSAAYATEPQLSPLNPASTIASDPSYTDPRFAGSDSISYIIPLTDIDGQPASVKVTMEYQTIPPAYLAQRFKNGQLSNGNFLPATERSIYLTSHLNTNLQLKSEHPDNPDLIFSQNWTTSIYQAEKEL